MAASPLFDSVTEAMETGSSLDRLEARGTLRIALKSAGLDADSVTPAQMLVVIERVLPGELSARKIEAVDALCGSLVTVVKTVEASGAISHTEAPEDVFRRTRGEAS